MTNMVPSEPIPLQENNEYRIGAVTYQVAAHFCSQSPPLKEKLAHIMMEEIRAKKAYSLPIGDKML